MGLWVQNEQGLTLRASFVVISCALLAPANLAPATFMFVLIRDILQCFLFCIFARFRRRRSVAGDWKVHHTTFFLRDANEPTRK